MSEALSKLTIMSAFDHRLLIDHRYAIIDTSQRELIPAHWRSEVIAPFFLDQDTARCPLLVDLRSISRVDHDTWLTTTAEQLQAGGPLWFSVLLQCDAEIAPVLAHLQNRIALKSADHEAPLQFRFYDPHTLTHLPRILNDVGMSWLMGRIDAMTYALPFTCERMFNRIQRPSQPSEPFRLNHEQRTQLQHLSVINRALVRLPALQNEMVWRAKAQEATALHLRTQRYALTAQEDQITFILHGLTQHERFDEHPKITTLLQRLGKTTPEDELDYCEITAGLTESDWQQIAHELNATNTRKEIT
jgi:Domain of unknown function (DUF4123)